MPGDAVTFVVDDPEAFFSPRAISTNSTDSKESAGHGNSHTESHNPMQATAVEGGNSRSSSTNSNIELTSKSARCSASGDFSERDKEQRISLPAASPQAMSMSRLQESLEDHNAADERYSDPASQVRKFNIDIVFFLSSFVSFSLIDTTCLQ